MPLEVVAITTTSTSVTVRWNTYEHMPSECGFVASYAVNLFTDSFFLASLTGQSPLHMVTVAANSTMATVENLEENTDYFVYLRAFCLYQARNVFAEQVYSFNTFVPLFEIYSVTPSGNDASLTWTVPPCSEPTYDVIAQVGCKAGGSDAAEVVDRSIRNYTTISSLLPYTLYDFTVIAHCNATYQTCSHSVCARTDSAPPSITNSSAGITTVSISFERSTCNSFVYEFNVTTGCETMPDSNVEEYRVFNMTLDDGTAQQPASDPERQDILDFHLTHCMV